MRCKAVVSELRAQEELDNRIFFRSDNGFHMGQHLPL